VISRQGGAWLAWKGFYRGYRRTLGLILTGQTVLISGQSQTPKKDAKDEVGGIVLVIFDSREADGLKAIDLGLAGRQRRGPLWKDHAALKS
jgi:hypothetical protein